MRHLRRLSRASPPRGIPLMLTPWACNAHVGRVRGATPLAPKRRRRRRLCRYPCASSDVGLLRFCGTSDRGRGRFGAGHCAVLATKASHHGLLADVAFETIVISRSRLALSMPPYASCMGLLGKHYAVGRPFQEVSSCSKRDWFDRRAVATVCR